MNNRFSGNGELGHLADDQSSDKQLPIERVDSLADELAADYDNPGFRVWYCGVIYEFGFKQVAEWRRKAASGRTPGGLFGYYVKQARAKKAASGSQQPKPTGFVADKPYTPTDYEMEHVDETVGEAIDQFLDGDNQPGEQQ